MSSLGGGKLQSKRDGRPLIFSIWQELAADDFKLREVIEFSFARKHIEIEHAERLARRGIGHGVELEIVDPFLRAAIFSNFRPKMLW